MLTTVVLWSLVIWAEPKQSYRGIGSLHIPGFATEQACSTQLNRIIETNNAQRRVDIKWAFCLPVETVR